MVFFSLVILEYVQTTFSKMLIYPGVEFEVIKFSILLLETWNEKKGLIWLCFPFSDSNSMRLNALGMADCLQSIDQQVLFGNKRIT